MSHPADLVIPAENGAALAEIFSWDGLRTATLSSSEFPVDVVRFDGAASRPLIVSRARRAATVKALPATLRERAQAAFQRFAREPESLPLAHGEALRFDAGLVVMGVVNVTPDSFSDGGETFDRGRAIERGLAMFEEGAAIVDVGGESTRPASYGAAEEVDPAEEMRRVLPVIEGIRRSSSAPLSIDTRKAAVARAAIGAGANLVNDVSALRYDAEMAAAARETGSGLVLMHMKGRDPRTMQDDVVYAHPLADIASFLAEAAAAAVAAGIAREKIAVDPGLGFGKSARGNLVLLRHLAAFRSLGLPITIGASRKGFVRRFSGVADSASAADRVPGSLACVAAAAEAGAAVVRVHDVAESVRFLRMWAAIRRTPAAADAVSGAAAQ